MDERQEVLLRARILTEASRTVGYMQGAGGRLQGFGDCLNTPAITKAFGELAAAIEAAAIVLAVETEQQERENQIAAQVVGR